METGRRRGWGQDRDHNWDGTIFGGHVEVMTSSPPDRATHFPPRRSSRPNIGSPLSRLHDVVTTKMLSETDISQKS